MSPWEFKVGQVVGYRPRGPLWRAKVTTIEREGKPFVAEIPIADESGAPISYEEPPAVVNPIIDYENYYLVEDIASPATEPWLAARLDHQDMAQAWKAFAERIGLRESYFPALALLLERWAALERRGDLLDDLLVLLHATWHAGVVSSNKDCARLLEKQGKQEEADAVRDLLK